MLLARYTRAARSWLAETIKRELGFAGASHEDGQLYTDLDRTDP